VTTLLAAHWTVSASSYFQVSRVDAVCGEHCDAEAPPMSASVYITAEPPIGFSTSLPSNATSLGQRHPAGDERIQ
jgi:hypothetical protein